VKKAITWATLVLTTLAATVVPAENRLRLQALGDYMYLTPAGAQWSLHGLINPAALSAAEYPDVLAACTFAPDQTPRLERCALAVAGAKTGAHCRSFFVDDSWGLDLRIARAFGSRAFSAGLGAGYTRGTLPYFDRSVLLAGGLHTRPARYVSAGLAMHGALDGAFWESIITGSLRPLGSPALALSSDLSVGDIEGDGVRTSWSVAAATEFIDGIRISARYFNDRRLALGVHAGLGHIGLATQYQSDLERSGGSQTAVFRGGTYRPSAIMEPVMRNRRFLELDLHPPLPYRRFALFDPGPTLLSLSRSLRDALRDPLIGGIAIRASEIQTSREKLWEIRSLLQQCRQAGKTIYIYVDRLWFDQYHFASVADTIVMDPHGLLILPGYAAGSTFYKNTLDKLGIGFDSWRYLEYKSAFEQYTRTRMSDSARHQREELIEDFYRLARAEVCESRGFTESHFDSLVNQGAVFRPAEALAANLIDTIGRWEAVSSLIDSATRGKGKLDSREAIQRRARAARDRWDDRPVIALVYALGATSMESGMKARSLSRTIDKLAADKQIDAVVVRADSPGGDAMAAALVGDAIRRCAHKKPCIVSMGTVAASGGYWISMYGETIVAAPQTVTGSIGVIGAWVYDSGAAEKLGFSTDHVHIGDHADLMANWRLPFLGLGLPVRNLTEEEQTRAREIILSMYREFVEQVSGTRDLSTDSVETLARGRVWSGAAAYQRGLADTLGTLALALDLAARGAGADGFEHAAIREYPERQLLSLARIRRQLLGIRHQSDWLLDYTRFFAEYNGLPLMILPPEYAPAYGARP
jgi:protease-4